MIEAYQNMVGKLLGLAYRDVYYAKKLVDESKTGKCPAASEIVEDVTEFIYRPGWMDTFCELAEIQPEVYRRKVELALDEFWSVVERKGA